MKKENWLWVVHILLVARISFKKEKRKERKSKEKLN